MAASIVGAAVAVVVSPIFTVFLNHVLATKREYDARHWVARGKHLERLRSILTTDATKLTGLADELRKYGRLTPAGPNLSASVRTGDAELERLYEDVLSHDIREHSSEYDIHKEKLSKDLSAHNRKFFEAAQDLIKEITIPREAERHRTGVALAIMEKCLKLGPGITFTATDGTFQYQSPIESIGGGNPAPPDVVAARDGFNLYRLTEKTTTTCEELRSGSDRLVRDVTELSSEARRLAEETNLTGDCRYTKVD